VRALALALAVSLPAAAPAQERPSKAVPALPKAPKLTGDAKELSKGAPVVPFSHGTTTVTAHAAYFKTSLYIGVEVKDPQVDARDSLMVMLQFPNAGPTAPGYVYRFSPDGAKAPAEGEHAAPAFAQALVKSEGVGNPDGVSLEIEIPARALPRFPATDPMSFDLCLTYKDFEQQEAATNCRGASMGKEALRLPDDFRKKLGLKPSSHATGIEGQEHGWLGYGILHYPVWVEADAPLRRDSLRAMVAAGDAVDPAAANVNLPEELQMKKTVFLTVLSGQDPYAQEGKCDAERELRIGLYLLKGRTAERVLEWPGSNCALGRATSVSLEDEGTLTIGYSNGSTVTFAWSGDRFERTELGRK